jgi:hypothetical protein
MTSDQHTPGFHVYAELPSGKQLVPGDALSCPGRSTVTEERFSRIETRRPMYLRCIRPMGVA